MGNLRNRINKSSDDYYVEGEGSRHARKRMHSNQIDNKMNALTIALGVGLIIGWINIKNLTLLYWGIGISLFGGLTTWLTYRKRMNE